MRNYANVNGNSGIIGYITEADSITVLFRNTARPYTYSYQKAGCAHVETMKQLAEQGYGLNSYIKRYANKLYD